MQGLISLMVSVDELSSKRKELFEVVLGTGRFASGFRHEVVSVTLTSAKDESFTFISATVVVVAGEDPCARTMVW